MNKRCYISILLFLILLFLPQIVLSQDEQPAEVSTVTLNVQPDGSFAVETIEGIIGYVTPGEDPVTFDIGGGDVVTIGVPVAGDVSISVNSGEIQAQMPGGIELNLDSGDEVVVSENAEYGNAEIVVVGGDGIDVVDTYTGETVSVAVGGDIEVQTMVAEGGESLMNFGADIMGGGEGNTDGNDGGYNGSGQNSGQSAIPDPFFGTSVSQLNQTQQESSAEDDDEEADSDGDGVPDSEDAFPTDPDETADADGDGVGNNSDAFPTDSTETTDTDGDLFGDNADIDADGDGIPDDYDKFPLDIVNANNFFDNFSNGLGKWDTATNVSIDTSFGPIVAPVPPGGGVGMSGDNHFAIVKTTFAGPGLLSKQFNFAESANRTFSFNYNFVTSEPPAVTSFNDFFEARLHLPDDSTVVLEHVEVTDAVGNPGFFEVVQAPIIPGPPVNVGQTGWMFSSNDVFVPGGLTTLDFHVSNDGSDFVQSAVLIDNVMDPPIAGDTQSTDTNVWMTFAQMIRDDIDISDGFESNPEYQAYIDNVENAIVDLEENPGSLRLADLFGNIWTEKDELFDSDYPQHASVAMFVLTAKEIAESENGFEVNLDSIRDSLSLAKTYMENHINDFGDTVDTGIKVLINGILSEIDEVLDTSDILTMNTIKGDIKDTFCNIVNNLNHSNSMEEENPFHFCHGNMDEGS